MNGSLGIYQTVAELDHDVEILVDALTRELESRGVGPTVAALAVRRAARASR